MGLNITQAMNFSQFENRENLRNTAKNILNKQTDSQETVRRIINDTIFTSQTRESAQLSVLKASTQISINESLKETLKYLKSQGYKKVKTTPKFGEIYSIFSEKETAYNGVLVDFEIDYSAKNIFSVA